MAARRAKVVRGRRGLGDEALKARKKRLLEKRAADGRPNGLVEVPGPLRASVRDEILALARSLEKKERRPGFRVLQISDFEGGVAIETDSEKFAQKLADAIGRSRHAQVTRVYDDEGARRILTCRLPEKFLER
jgi:hypothetical protein